MLAAASRSLSKNTGLVEQNRCRAKKAATRMLSCCSVMRAQKLQHHFVSALWTSNDLPLRFGRFNHPHSEGCDVLLCLYEGLWLLFPAGSVEDHPYRMLAARDCSKAASIVKVRVQQVFFQDEVPLLRKSKEQTTAQHSSKPLRWFCSHRSPAFDAYASLGQRRVVRSRLTRSILQTAKTSTGFCRHL